MKTLYWLVVQNPFTGSTTARLYQLLSKKTISPASRCALVASADLGNAESERLNEALERGLTAYTYLDDSPL